VNPTASPYIKALTLYPIKGCRGVDVGQAHALATGLAVQQNDGQWIGDRQYMVVDSHGVFITQREVPAMATIAVLLTPEGIVLRAPDHPDIAVPACTKERAVTVWNFEGYGLDAGSKVMAWLSSVLQRPAALVKFSPSQPRHCKPLGTHLSNTFFADSFGYLIISQASVSDLERRLRQHYQNSQLALPADRFRANVLIDGVEAFEEDFVDTFTVEGNADQGRPLDALLKVVSKCVRCNVPSVDQLTGKVQLEAPTPLLDTFRLDIALGGSTIGVNAINVQGSGQNLLRIGDKLTLQHAF
jgi:uncharacterized protein